MPKKLFKGLNTGNRIRKITTTPHYLTSSDLSTNLFKYKSLIKKDLTIQNYEFKEGIEYSTNKHKLWELKDRVTEALCSGGDDGKICPWGKDNIINVYDFKALPDQNKGNCASILHYKSHKEEVPNTETFIPHATFLNANSVVCAEEKSKISKTPKKITRPLHVGRGQQRIPTNSKRKNNTCSRLRNNTRVERWNAEIEATNRANELARLERDVEKLDLFFITPASKRSQLPYQLLYHEVRNKSINDKRSCPCGHNEKKFTRATVFQDERKYFDQYVGALEDYFDCEEADYFKKNDEEVEYEQRYNNQRNFLLNDFITTNEIREKLASKSQLKKLSKYKKHNTPQLKSDLSSDNSKIISNEQFLLEGDANDIIEITSSNLNITNPTVTLRPNVNLFLDNGALLSVLRVKLSVVSFKELSTIYSDRYLEGYSSPVRIAIDVSQDITSSSSSSTAYIIFQINNYLTEADAYECSLSFNTAWNNITTLSDLNTFLDPDCIYNAKSLIELVTEHIRCCLDVRKKDIPHVGFPQIIEETQKKDGVVLSHLTLSRRQVFASMISIESTDANISLEVKNLETNSNMLNSLQDKLVKKADNLVCKICFEDCNEDNSTELVNCRHTFCINCWKDHIVSAIKMGKLSLQCPYKGCCEIVDAVTVLSFVSLSLYNAHKNLIITNKIEKSHFYNWCPNVKCGAILVLKPRLRNAVALKSAINILCACGAYTCFLCQQEAHWPAPCNVAKKYLKKMRDLGDDIVDLVDVKELDVEGKPCPSCRKFIEKMGGCDHISCACGFEFCWYCLNESSKHSSHYACNGSNEFEAADNVTLQLRGALADFSRSRIYCQCLQRRYLRNKFTLSNLSKNLLTPLITYMQQLKFASTSVNEFMQSNADNFQLPVDNAHKYNELRLEVEAIICKYKELICTSEYSLVYYMHIRKSHKVKASILLRFYSLLTFTSFRIKELLDLLCGTEKLVYTYNKMHQSMVSLKKLFNMSDTIILNLDQLLKC